MSYFTIRNYKVSCACVRNTSLQHSCVTVVKLCCSFVCSCLRLYAFHTAAQLPFYNKTPQLWQDTTELITPI